MVGKGECCRSMYGDFLGIAPHTEFSTQLPETLHLRAQGFGLRGEDSGLRTYRSKI